METDSGEGSRGTVIRDPEQGQSARCVNYVVFFMALPAVHSGRVVALVMTSLVTLIYTLVTLHELYNHYRSYKKARGKKASRMHASDDTLLNIRSQNDVELNAEPKERRPRAVNRVQTFSHMRLKGDPMLVGIGICQVLVFVYFVTCSELLLTHNMVDNSNKEWGFGQVRRYPPYPFSKYNVTDLFVSSLPI